ncbi:DUF928 domain-containing protein [Aulosira sp. FACHB-615]|uniref:DUF928 domain-containing protein n=1 Tax=Aulosira sp. FACHB-615 TaxID=2692777 RepID=UPI001686E252|nr:DUF928 domain-containing protein [Aulosira sp. FACHB-615]MBD2492007.1 DUF928 domain-containing protein [Aulosira sp. FACHB-615]
MNSFNQIRFYLLILAINITGLPLFFNLNLKAETKQTNSLLSWVNIFLPLSKPKPPVKPRKAVGRPLRDSSAPSPVCMISPDVLEDTPNKARVIWSDRPLFLWEGNVQQVGLMKNRKTTLWVQQLALGKQFISYTGEPLQPGETYYWVVFDGDIATGNIKFQIMEAQDRHDITNQLKTLEEEQKAKGANPEEIALAKANYFIQRDLWADALQQAYSVESPSKELLKIRQNIPQQLKSECGNKS